VDPGHLDAAVLLRAVVAAERADDHGQEQAQADEDVGAMQAGEAVEDRSLRVVVGREADVRRTR
jgi:hypothetical protein